MSNRIDYQARIEAARVADSAAWAALVAAKGRLDEATFNLGDDLDRMEAAAEVFRAAIRNLKDCQYHLWAEQAIAAEAFRQSQTERTEKAIAAALDTHTSHVVGLTERAMARPVDGGEHADEAPHLPRTSFLEGT